MAYASSCWEFLCTKPIRKWDKLSLKHRYEVVSLIIEKSRKETMAPFDWEVSWWWVVLVLFHCSVVIIAVSYDKRCSTQFILCNMWGNCTCFQYRCRFGNTRLWTLYNIIVSFKAQLLHCILQKTKAFIILSTQKSLSHSKTS